MIELKALLTSEMQEAILKSTKKWYEKLHKTVIKEELKKIDAVYIGEVYQEPKKED